MKKRFKPIDAIKTHRCDCPIHKCSIEPEDTYFIEIPADPESFITKRMRLCWKCHAEECYLKQPLPKGQKKLNRRS